MGPWPSEAAVLDGWNKYALENKSLVEHELELLSLNQRRVLHMLARWDEPKEIFSKEVIANLHMSSSSISGAVKFLIEKDYVLINANGAYQILDPLIKTILKSDS